MLLTPVPPGKSRRYPELEAELLANTGLSSRFPPHAARNGHNRTKLRNEVPPVTSRATPLPSESQGVSKTPCDSVATIIQPPGTTLRPHFLANYGPRSDPLRANRLHHTGRNPAVRPLRVLFLPDRPAPLAPHIPTHSISNRQHSGQLATAIPSLTITSRIAPALDAASPLP
jgi:hypothetical protein